MLKLRDGLKILVGTEPIDARKSIDSLSSLVNEYFNDNPQSGNLFIFFNKSKDKVKILYWEHTGFVLHYKRLEKHRFKVPNRTNPSHFEITETQLHGLLAGLDFSLMRHYPEINYHQYA